MSESSSVSDVRYNRRVSMATFFLLTPLVVAGGGVLASGAGAVSACMVYLLLTGDFWSTGALVHFLFRSQSGKLAFLIIFSLKMVFVLVVLYLLAFVVRLHLFSMAVGVSGAVVWMLVKTALYRAE